MISDLMSATGAGRAAFQDQQSCPNGSAVSCRQIAGSGETATGSGGRSCARRPISRRAAVRPSLFDQAGMARFFVAFFPSAPAAHLAHAIGGRASTAEKWLRGETTPNAAAIAAMILEFGPAFLLACLADPAPWCADAARRERRAVLEAELSELKD